MEGVIGRFMTKLTTKKRILFVLLLHLCGPCLLDTLNRSSSAYAFVLDFD